MTAEAAQNFTTEFSEDDLAFDSDASYAVCIGGRGDLKKPPEAGICDDMEADAIGVRKMLIEKGRISECRVHLLTEQQQGDDDKPNRENILKAIKAAAAAVKTDGVFFVHFSGHSDKTETGVALIPHDIQHPIHAQQFVDVVKGSKARAIVLSLSCCYAGGFAQEVCIAMSKKEVPVFVLAACTVTQKGQLWPITNKRQKTPYGLFTFVFLHFLNEQMQCNWLPLQSLQRYVRLVYKNLNILQEEGLTSGLTKTNPEFFTVGTLALSRNFPKKDMVSSTLFTFLQKKNAQEVNTDEQHVGNLEDLLHQGSETAHELAFETALETADAWLRQTAESAEQLHTKEKKVFPPQLSTLMYDDGFRKILFGHTVFSLVAVLLKDSEIYREPLCEPQLMFKLWKCFYHRIPSLLSYSSENIRDIFWFFCSYKEKLKDMQFTEQELTKIYETIEICKSFHSKPNGEDGEVEYIEFEEVDLQCAIPFLPPLH